RAQLRTDSARRELNGAMAVVLLRARSKATSCLVSGCEGNRGEVRLLSFLLNEQRPSSLCDIFCNQRGRQKDMTQLVNRYPQLLGIGIDEGTAIEVQKSVAKVVGNGRVFFYDKAAKVKDGAEDYIALAAGSVYDLAERKIEVDKREP
ncbi:hypothetical protein N9897_00970, partial [bacterium]|nr:hypothetical protein [bacterium]